MHSKVCVYSGNALAEVSCESGKKACKLFFVGWLHRRSCITHVGYYRADPGPEPEPGAAASGMVQKQQWPHGWAPCRPEAGTAKCISGSGATGSAVLRWTARIMLPRLAGDACTLDGVVVDGVGLFLLEEGRQTG